MVLGLLVGSSGLARCVLGFDVGFEGPVITFLVFGVFGVLMMRAAVLGARVRGM